jgi:zinc transporter 1/2/3
MFFIELMASRFDVFGDHAGDTEKSDPPTELIRGSEKCGDTDSTLQNGNHSPLVCHEIVGLAVTPLSIFFCIRY